MNAIFFPFPPGCWSNSVISLTIQTYRGQGEFWKVIICLSLFFSLLPSRYIHTETWPSILPNCKGYYRPAFNKTVAPSLFKSTRGRGTIRKSSCLVFSCTSRLFLQVLWFSIFFTFLLFFSVFLFSDKLLFRWPCDAPSLKTEMKVLRWHKFMGQVSQRFCLF